MALTIKKNSLTFAAGFDFKVLSICKCMEDGKFNILTKVGL